MPGNLQQEILNSDLIYPVVRSFPNPELIEDEALNDSDKTLTVDSGEIWHFLWIWAELITTATSGSRQIELHVTDSADDEILVTLALNTQGPSVTEYYTFSPNGQEPKETTATRHFIPIPPLLYLPPGYKIRIWDVSAVDPTADDLIIHAMVNRFDIT